MGYLPAPYESAPDDDLGSATAATLAASVGALISVSLGMQVARQFPAAKQALDAGTLTGARMELVVVTTGWAAAAALMGLGALLLLFRRGRGLLVLGALVGVATTGVARYEFGWFTASHPLANIAVYFGGVAVFVLALLPGTRRWIAGRGRRRGALPPVLSATALAPTRVQIGPAR